MSVSRSCIADNVSTLHRLLVELLDTLHPARQTNSVSALIQHRCNNSKSTTTTTTSSTRPTTTGPTTTATTACSRPTSLDIINASDVADSLTVQPLHPLTTVSSQDSNKNVDVEAVDGYNKHNQRTSTSTSAAAATTTITTTDNMWSDIYEKALDLLLETVSNTSHTADSPVERLGPVDGVAAASRSPGSDTEDLLDALRQTTLTYFNDVTLQRVFSLESENSLDGNSNATNDDVISTCGLSPSPNCVINNSPSRTAEPDTMASLPLRVDSKKSSLPQDNDLETELNPQLTSCRLIGHQLSYDHGDEVCGPDDVNDRKYIRHDATRNSSSGGRQSGKICDVNNDKRKRVSGDVTSFSASSDDSGDDLVLDSKTRDNLLTSDYFTENFNYNTRATQFSDVYLMTSLTGASRTSSCEVIVDDDDADSDVIVRRTSISSSLVSEQSATTTTTDDESSYSTDYCTNYDCPDDFLSLNCQQLFNNSNHPQFSWTGCCSKPVDGYEYEQCRRNSESSAQRIAIIDDCSATSLGRTQSVNSLLTDCSLSTPIVETFPVEIRVAKNCKIHNLPFIKASIV